MLITTGHMTALASETNWDYILFNLHLLATTIGPNPKWTSDSLKTVKLKILYKCCKTLVHSYINGDRMRVSFLFGGAGHPTHSLTLVSCLTTELHPSSPVIWGLSFLHFPNFEVIYKLFIKLSICLSLLKLCFENLKSIEA